MFVKTHCSGLPLCPLRLLFIRRNSDRLHCYKGLYGNSWDGEGGVNIMFHFIKKQNPPQYYYFIFEPSPWSRKKTVLLLPLNELTRQWHQHGFLSNLRWRNIFGPYLDSNQTKGSIFMSVLWPAQKALQQFGMFPTLRKFKSLDTETGLLSSACGKLFWNKI